jgi:hypothetical protein
MFIPVLSAVLAPPEPFRPVRCACPSQLLSVRLQMMTAWMPENSHMFPNIFQASQYPLMTTILFYVNPNLYPAWQVSALYYLSSSFSSSHDGIIVDGTFGKDAINVKGGVSTRLDALKTV